MSRNPCECKSLWVLIKTSTGCAPQTGVHQAISYADRSTNISGRNGKKVACETSDTTASVCYCQIRAAAEAVGIRSCRPASQQLQLAEFPTCLPCRGENQAEPWRSRLKPRGQFPPSAGPLLRVGVPGLSYLELSFTSCGRKVLVLVSFFF